MKLETRLGNREAKLNVDATDAQSRGETWEQCIAAQ